MIVFIVQHPTGYIVEVFSIESYALGYVHRHKQEQLEVIAREVDRISLNLKSESIPSREMNSSEQKGK